MDFRTFRVAPPSDGSDRSPVLTEDVRLTAEEIRVLGCLIEKESTTPDTYPLSLNALTTACNQKSSRDPVVDYVEAQVQGALDSLQQHGLVRRISSSDSRVLRYRHVAPDALRLDKPQTAVLAVLMLRGRQTVGELRQRSQRIYPFEQLAEVEEALQELSEKQPRSLVRKLPRQPGTKDSRWMHLMAEEGDAEIEEAETVSAVPVREARSELRDEVEQLREEMSALREEFERFKQQFS